MKSKLSSICSLTIAFIILSIAIPLVQVQIDKKASLYNHWRFHAQEAILKYNSFMDKYDTGHFLAVIRTQGPISQKHDTIILKIQNRLMIRCRELLASSIMLLSSDPGGPIERDKQRYQQLLNTDIEELMAIEKEARNKPIPAATNIQEDMLFWSEIRTWLYAIGGLFFIGGAVLEILTVDTSLKGKAQGSGSSD